MGMQQVFSAGTLWCSWFPESGILSVAAAQDREGTEIERQTHKGTEEQNDRDRQLQ